MKFFRFSYRWVVNIFPAICREDLEPKGTIVDIDGQLKPMAIYISTDTNTPHCISDAARYQGPTSTHKVGGGRLDKKQFRASGGPNTRPLPHPFSKHSACRVLAFLMRLYVAFGEVSTASFEQWQPVDPSAFAVGVEPPGPRHTFSTGWRTTSVLLLGAPAGVQDRRV